MKRLYQRYANFIAQRLPIYRWAIPVFTMDVFALVAAGVCYIFIGSHWVTVTLAILGCSLFSTFHFMIRRPSMHCKAHEKHCTGNEE